MRLKHLFVLLTVILMMGVVFDVSAEVTTTRDDKGVWFVKGMHLTVFTTPLRQWGMRVAQDRLCTDTVRRGARGRLAEIFGPDYLSRMSWCT
ncbi:MAG: penicillin acylase family protein [Desulfobacterales bacterium]